MNDPNTESGRRSKEFLNWLWEDVESISWEATLKIRQALLNCELVLYSLLQSVK